MFRRYDTSTAAWVDANTVKRYDASSSAWINAQSVKIYDATAQAWVEKLKKLMTLEVTSPFYNTSGSTIYLTDDFLYLDVKAASSSYYVRATVEGDFVNPIISGAYTFGHSDMVTDASYYSHEAVRWNVNGYLNGTKTSTTAIASGASYRTTTIFNEPFSLTLSGTFDEIELECQIISFSAYSSYGLINTQIQDIAIDGLTCSGYATLTT